MLESSVIVTLFCLIVGFSQGTALKKKKCWKGKENKRSSVQLSSKMTHFASVKQLWPSFTNGVSLFPKAGAVKADEGIRGKRR